MERVKDKVQVEIVLLLQAQETPLIKINCWRIQQFSQLYIIAPGFKSIFSFCGPYIVMDFSFLNFGEHLTCVLIIALCDINLFGSSLGTLSFTPIVPHVHSIITTSSKVI